jgi:hypothetical protein
MLFVACTKRSGLVDVRISAKLAPDRFTIVGPDEALAGPLRKAEQLEGLLNEALADELKGA